MGFVGEPFNRHHLHEFTPDAGHHPAPQFLTAQQQVQVYGIAWQLHRMIDAGQAKLQPAQEIVVRRLLAVLGHNLGSAQSGELHCIGEARLD